MSEIKAGDIVFLKGDMKTRLTVEYVFNDGVNRNLAVETAKCAWILVGEKKEANFSLDSLVKVE